MSRSRLRMILAPAAAAAIVAAQLPPASTLAFAPRGDQASANGRRADAAAKEQLRTAQTTIEVYRHEFNTYKGATRASLIRIEPALARPPAIKVEYATASSFRLSVRSAARHTFTVSRKSDKYRRTCSPKGRGLCPPNGRW